MREKNKQHSEFECTRLQTPSTPEILDTEVNITNKYPGEASVEQQVYEVVSDTENLARYAAGKVGES